MHQFFALSGTLCSSGCIPSDGSHLGVDCSSSDSASFMGYQPRLGPKFEVNATSGVFPFPATDINQTGPPTYKRLQVHDADLDPFLNAGAQYFVELQILSHDDATAGALHDNASFRPIVVFGSGGVFDVVPTGSTVSGKPAIEAWRASDPDVVLTDLLVPGDGRLIVGAKVTPVAAGWRYEYAVQNLNSHRSAGAFWVPVPASAVVSNLGFHDVDYHSGEPFAGTDWAASVTGSAVVFATEPYSENPDANALRWGTLYNFRFDCDVPPATDEATIGLFRPGAPGAVAVMTLTPRVCDADGVCDPGETCANCPGDCAGQGGGQGCCGDGACETGENPCLCAADCGAAAAIEGVCGNAIDDDCDGSADCADADCCLAAACAAEDADGDTRAAVCDCDDADSHAWSVPGEVRDVRVTPAEGGASITWTAPADPGGSSLTYDLLRSPSTSDFLAAGQCLFVPDPAAEAFVDDQDPPAGSLFGYLVRARNACPGGPGTLGAGSGGEPREGRACP